MAVKSCLGFYLGPGNADNSWKLPMKKFREHVNMWQDQPLGQFVFNTFAITTLGYIAQLEDPPKWVLEEVEKSLTRMAKGPRFWASARGLWALKEAFGMRASLRHLDWLAQAAKVRTVSFEQYQ